MRGIAMKRVFSFIRNQVLFIIVLCLLFLIVVTANNRYEVVTNNINSARSIQAIHLVSKYNPEEVKVKTVSTFADVLKYGPSSPVKFNGIMTGYVPACWAVRK